jgi:hypothetical protein
VEHEDLLGAEGDGAIERDAVDDPAVDEVLAVDPNRGEDPRNGARREDGLDERAAAEPVLGAALDARRDALERHAEVLEPLRVEQARREPPKRVARADVGARSQQDGRVGEPGSPERSEAGELGLRGLELLDRRDRRVAGDHRAV